MSPRSRQLAQIVDNRLFEDCDFAALGLEQRVRLQRLRLAHRCGASRMVQLRPANREDAFELGRVDRRIPSGPTVIDSLPEPSPGGLLPCPCR